jgi:hypothetical protein
MYLTVPVNITRTRLTWATTGDSHGPGSERTQPLHPPARPLSSLTGNRHPPVCSTLHPNAYWRCHGSGHWVSSQEHGGMVDLGADSDPGTR